MPAVLWTLSERFSSQPWQFATPVLAGLSSLLSGGVAELFGTCHSGASSLEN